MPLPREGAETIAGVSPVSFDLLLPLIGETKTASGLHVEARRGETLYEKGTVVTNKEMRALATEKHAAFPPWNDAIRPRKPGSNKREFGIGNGESDMLSRFRSKDVIPA